MTRSRVLAHLVVFTAVSHATVTPSRAQGGAAGDTARATQRRDTRTHAPCTHQCTS